MKGKKVYVKNFINFHKQDDEVLQEAKKSIHLLKKSYTLLEI